jgi:hypothetical protein
MPKKYAADIIPIAICECPISPSSKAEKVVKKPLPNDKTHIAIIGVKISNKVFFISLIYNKFVTTKVEYIKYFYITICFKYFQVKYQ